MTTAAVNYKGALMDSIYEAGIPASQERVFDFVMMNYRGGSRSRLSNILTSKKNALPALLCTLGIKIN